MKRFNVIRAVISKNVNKPAKVIKVAKSYQATVDIKKLIRNPKRGTFANDNIIISEIDTVTHNMHYINIIVFESHYMFNFNVMVEALFSLMDTGSYRPFTKLEELYSALNDLVKSSIDLDKEVDKSLRSSNY